MATVKDHDPLQASIGGLHDDFHELDRRLGRFNLLEAVGVRAELRHSNFLVFIFSPNRSKGWDRWC